MNLRPACRQLLLPVLLALLMPAAEAAGSPEVWLDRMQTALRELNYRGTFIYLQGRGERAETFFIVHRGDAQGGIERLVTLSGPRQEIIRNHREVQCIRPASRSVLVERRYHAAHFPGAVPSALAVKQLTAYYRFRDLGRNRVAGYPSRLIAIEPRDAYRYGYRLWLDQRSGMLLRSDLLDADSRPVAQMLFTTLSYPHTIPDSALRPTELGPGYVWNIQGDPEALPPAQARLHWQAVELPQGFHLSLSDVLRVAGISQPVRHLVYSDGLASVSVYVEPVAEGHKLLLGPAQMGAVSAFGRLLAAHHITVVGEVPPRTVAMIARSLRVESR